MINNDTFTRSCSNINDETYVRFDKANQLAQENQKKVDHIVRKILNCSQIIETFPTLASYKSHFRQMDSDNKRLLSETEKKLEEIISAINQGHEVKENYKKLGLIIPEMRHGDPKNFSTDQQLEHLEEYTAVFLKLFSFANENKEALMAPSIYQSFFNKTDLTAVTEESLDRSLKTLHNTYETLAKAMFQSYCRKLHANRIFLLKIDRIISNTSEYFRIKKEKPENNFHPLERVENEFFNILKEIDKKSIKNTLTPAYLKEAIQANEEMENIAEDFLNDNNEESVLKKSQQFFNKITLSTLPVAVRLKALKSLAEMDPLYANYFQNELIKLVDSILKEEENKQSKDNLDKESETSRESECPIQ